MILDAMVTGVSSKRDMTGVREREVWIIATPCKARQRKVWGGPAVHQEHTAPNMRQHCSWQFSFVWNGRKGSLEEEPFHERDL